MTIGGDSPPRSLYLYSENPVYYASPSIWPERGSPQDIQTPLEKVFGTPQNAKHTFSGGIWMCKDCQNFKRLQQTFSGFPCWSFHSVQEFTTCPGFRLIFCFSRPQKNFTVCQPLADYQLNQHRLVFIHPIQRLPKSVLDTKFSKTRLPEKKKTVCFCKRKIMRVKKTVHPIQPLVT